jgi:O-antigen/teichoic acid export membrane protein
MPSSISGTVNLRVAETISPLGVDNALGKWMSWAKKAGLAVLDQGLVAGSHFMINILLARWLEPSQYGAFAVSYLVFLLLGAFHTALLTEPMMVYGSGEYASIFPKYMAILIYGHWALTSLIATVLALCAGIAWLLDSTSMAQGLIGLAVASPFMLLLWLVRRGFYVSSNPQWSAIGGGLYLLVTVVGIYELNQYDRLTSASAFLVMGASGLIASLGFIGFLRPQWRLAREKAGIAMVFRNHWRYGRWAASTEVLASLSGAISYFVVVSILGLGGAAALKAMQNLVAPVNQFFVALALLLVPRSARRARGAISAVLTKDALNISIALGLPALLYCFLIIFLSSPIVSMLYAGKYVEYTMLIPFIAMASVFAGIGAGPQVLLRARARSDLVFLIALCGGCFSLIASIVLVLRFGLLGGAMGLSVSALFGACVAWWLWMKKGSSVCHQRS